MSTKDRKARESVGELIDDRYKLVRLMAEGGMGRVYEAEHVGIGKQVALKILHPILSSTADAVARFRREARIATQIGHPNIVDVTDSGTTADGHFYFVMEYLDGVELGSAIHAGLIDLRRALHIGRQIADALAAAHEQGIIHRDLKPENIVLIERDGNPDFVKVLDFGIARTVDADQPQRRLTQPGVAMGTPEYMAPEQALALTTDARSDIYSLGAILYEMTTGVQPYRADTFTQVLVQKASSEPRRPREVREDLPEAVETLILKAMARDPGARHQSMAEIASEITRCVEGGGDTVMPPAFIPAAPGLRTRTPRPERGSGAGAESGVDASIAHAPTSPDLRMTDAGAHAQMQSQPPPREPGAQADDHLLVEIEEVQEADDEASAGPPPPAAPLAPTDRGGEGSDTPADTRAHGPVRSSRLVFLIAMLIAVAGGAYWYRYRRAPAQERSAPEPTAQTSAAREPAAPAPLRRRGAAGSSAPAPPTDRVAPHPPRLTGDGGAALGSTAKASAQESAKPRAVERPAEGPPPTSVRQARALLSKALGAFEREQWDAAGSIYSRIAKGRFLKEWGHIGLARIALATGEATEASRHATTALRLGGGIPARMALARALAAMGRTAAAIKQYRHILRAEPRNQQAKRELGKLLAAERKRK